MREQIIEVLKRYFESDGKGNHNPEYDETFEAASAIDEIAKIVNF